MSSPNPPARLLLAGGVGGGLLTHPNHLCDWVASWEDSSSNCELHAALEAMLHKCFAYGLGCIAYVLFVARFVA